MDPRHDFGMSLRGKFCGVCDKWIINRGCPICEMRLCPQCFQEHHHESTSPPNPPTLVENKVVTTSVVVGRRNAIITGDAGIDMSKVLSAQPFKDWVDTISKEERIDINGIHIQSLDMFRSKVGFIKFQADAKVDGNKVPGIVFMRGGAVAILVILVFEGKKFTVLVRQPRVPVCNGNLPEIPAGMLDGDGNFAGVAAKEMKEETGIEINENNLIDMTHLVYRNTYPGMFPSCGGSDEFNRIFLFQKSVTAQELKDLNGKLTGVRSEMINLQIIPLDELWRKSPDAKALAALYLYMKLKASGRVPESPSLPPSNITIGGCEVALSAESGIDVRKAVEAKAFKDWVDSMAKEGRVKISKIHFQSLDLFGSKVAAVKFKATASIDGKDVPGIVFMRGGAVAVLVILRRGSDNFAVVVRQARVPVCSSSLVEIPVGILDDSGNFVGDAAQAMKEQASIEIKHDDRDLYDMTNLIQKTSGAKAPNEFPGMFPSCGASDEFNRLFVYLKYALPNEFTDLERKLTGIAAKGEMMKLQLIPLHELWRKTADAKALSALCVYEKLKKEKKVPLRPYCKRRKD